MKDIEFVVGRSNLSCTVFVPYDCKNNCPFCTSKEMYRDGRFSFNIDKIIKQIKKINCNPNIKEYVLTGGEPCSNLYMLKKIVDVMEKPIYINTTLPYSKDLVNVINYINGEDKIKGVNVSRHLNFPFKSVATPDDLNLITKPVRINVVLVGNEVNQEYFISKLKSFITIWGGNDRTINLRANYENINMDNLRTFDDVEKTLSRVFYHKGSGGCMVCNTTTFCDVEKNIVTYHRGIKYSSVKIENRLYINDIIITMDGSIWCDWDFTTVDGFNNWVFAYKPPKEITYSGNGCYSHYGSGCGYGGCHSGNYPHDNYRGCSVVFGGGRCY